MDEDRTAVRLRGFAGVAGAVVVALAVLALAGWWLHSAVLMGWGRSGVAMNPATSLALVLAGAALLAVRREPAGPRARGAAETLAVLVVLLGLIRILGYSLGVDVGPDAWAAGARAAGPGGMVNRMAPNTAIALAALGTSVALLDGRWARTQQAAALFTMLVAITALAGYAYRGNALYGVRGFIPMALNTAVALLLLGAAVLAARPGRGVTRLLVSPEAGSAVARRVLPWAIAVPMFVGWLMPRGLRSGWFDISLGTALIVTLTVVALVSVIWWAARVVDQMSSERRRFFDLSRDLLVVAGFDGKFLDVNPAWERALGWTREELTSRPFSEFVHPDDLTATSQEYAAANQGRDVTRFVNRYRTRAGEYRWLEWSASVAVADRAQYAVARDVTELREIERELHERVAQLHETNQELEAFSYSVSHDLRAPLRHMTGFADLLVARCGEQLGDEGRRWLAIIQDATRRMGALIDDLLNFSRIGRSALTMKEVDLTTVVSEAWSNVRPEANGREVRFDLEPLPAVSGDPALLRVVFDNLLHNALKYTGGRSAAHIEVRGCRQNDDVVITVTDNGVGFDMRHAHKLFGVFQRLHGSDQFEGNGIGLATVRRVVARHGGRVWAEAEPDRGATFHLALKPAAGATSA